MKALVDTNILVYALDEASPFYNNTRSFFEKIHKREFQPVVAQQNILEAQNTFVRDYKLSKKEVLENILQLVYSFEFTVIAPLAKTLSTYDMLLHKGIKQKNDIFDVYLAATMLTNRVGTIYTANTKDFVGIKEIEAINPLK